ncbi:MAG: ABC transporter ATP-binding protein [Firmicutes bacterium]|nr:ABC transporter ATP-binding protein [Bacillota bacterium]
MDIISTNGLTKKYKNQIVVDNLNLNVKKGEIYGFLGNNGAGKTTTMKMLLGLTEPTSGSINLFGEDIKRKNKLLKRVGSLIEYPGFYGNLTAYENLKIFADLYGVSKPKKIDELLEIGGLSQYKNKLVRKFSMGMKQRLGIIRTLINDPELLILDEPINGLDPNGIKEIREFLVSLSTEKKLTIMISSHILSEIEQMADKIGILHKGALCDEINVKEFKNNVNKFIEIKVNNVFEAVRILEEKLNIYSYEVRKDEIIIFERINDSHIINKTLIDKGLKVTKLYVNTLCLESYFTDITKGRVC